MKNIVVALFPMLELATVSMAHATADRCSETTSHVEQRSCLQAQFNEAEKRLLQAERAVIAKIAVWDEDSEYRLESKKALAASNSAFRKYRTNQCAYAWSLAAGGNGATDMRLSCAIELTESRIKLLEESSVDLQQR